MSAVAMGRRRRDAALLLVALGAIALQLDGDLRSSALALALWLGVLACWEPAVLRRLWLPKFWAMTAAVAVASGLWLGEPDLDLGPVEVSRAGLEAGAAMVARAAFVLALTSWLSRWAGRHDLRVLLRRFGFERFGHALTSAFELLPELSRQLQADRRRPAGGARRVVRWTRLEARAVRLVHRTAALAEMMADGGDERAAAGRLGSNAALGLFAVVAPPGRGKTTLVLRIAARLRQAGIGVGGVAQPAVVADGQRVGYRLRDLETGRERSFALRSSCPNRGFAFDRSGWAWAADRIVASTGPGQVVVVDELGLLEASGHGHLPALLRAARGSGPTAALIAVRGDAAAAIAERLGPWQEVFLPGETDPAEAAERIAGWLRRSPRRRPG